MVKFRRGVVLTRDSADKRKKERGHQNEKPENYSRASARGLRRGIRSTAKNDEGIPELTLYNETTVAFAEALHDLYFDNIGAVCETMAFRSYKTVISAYCETALKVKYSRDDQTAQMLDLINASATTNFGYVCFASIAGLEKVIEAYKS